MRAQILNSGPMRPVTTPAAPRLVSVPVPLPPSTIPIATMSAELSHAIDTDGRWLEENFLLVFPLGLFLFLIACAVLMT
jgi:hypothetical protein